MAEFSRFIADRGDRATGNVRRNRVLGHLASEDFALPQRHLQPIGPKVRQCVPVVNREIEVVYFPYSASISMLVRSDDRQHQCEVGLVGHEGPGPYGSGFVQVEGDGIRLPAQDLRKLMQTGGALRLALLRHVHGFAVQTVSHSTSEYERQGGTNVSWLLKLGHPNAARALG